MNGYRTKTVALVGLLSALSVVLSAVESALPPLPIPAARLGLSNIAVTVATASLSPIAGLCVVAVKVLFVLLSRGVTASWMALCGSVAAWLITAGLLPLWRAQRMSFVGIAVASATAHTLGQLTAASVLMTCAVFGYAPLMLVCSLLTGCVTGTLLNVMMSRLMPLSSSKSVTGG